MTYKPQYPILKREDMLPRDQIRLVSDEDLGPLVSAELKNLRRGVRYDYIVTNTPENRANLTVRTGYFQMVAYKEGWKFDPEKYQVRFVSQDDPRLLRVQEASSMLRLLKYTDEERNEGVVGFESKDDQQTFTRLEDQGASFLFNWFRKFFKLK